MQDQLFEPPQTDAAAPRGRRTAAGGVGAAAVDPAHRALAAGLPSSLRIGTSSWSYPGWTGLVWDRDHSASRLSKQGLRAYAEHPLLRTVSLDRAFYRPLTVDQYRALATQVPDDFRFVVKAPSLVADATVRDEDGRGLGPNPHFLDPGLALHEFVAPALAGLDHRLGALVFELSPLPSVVLAQPERFFAALARMLGGLPAFGCQAPDGVVAVELRNAELLSPALIPLLAQALKAGRATYCLGLHARMPPIEAQLPVLRRLWPGPLVCRWNLHRKHGPRGYEDARRLYGDFSRIVDPDPETRQALARVITGTTAAGHRAYVTIGNKAEGCAPLSVAALAAAVAAMRG